MSELQLPPRDVVVAGASAGGVEALVRFLGALPAEVAATFLVVLHVPTQRPSALPSILSRASKLDVAHARQGDPLVPGRVLVAPPDHHLVVRGDRVELSRGPRENGHRPAIDPLFRSAVAFGHRVIGVVLSGSMDDGAAGLLAIKRHGGLALVQAPEEALHASMPTAAIELVAVDAVLDTTALAERVVLEAGVVAGNAGPNGILSAVGEEDSGGGIG